MSLLGLELAGDAAVIGAVGIQTGLWMLMHWRIRSLEKRFDNGIQGKIEDIKEDVGNIKVECARRAGERANRNRRQ